MSSVHLAAPVSPRIYNSHEVAGNASPEQQTSQVEQTLPKTSFRLYVTSTPNVLEGIKRLVKVESSCTNSYAIINGIVIPHISEAANINLRQFRAMSQEEQELAITKFKLQNSLMDIGGEIWPQKLHQANEKALESVTLLDLQINPRTSKIQYALLSDEEFSKITVSQLSTISLAQMEVVVKRLEETSSLLPTADFNESVLDLPITQFHRVPGFRITTLMPILPPRTLQLITDHQLVDLDLATLTKEQLNELFLRQDDKEETKRLALLSSKQVQDSLEKLNPSLLKFITNTQLRDLDVSILPQEILEKLFCYINGETEKDRLASLATPQLQAILPKLASYQLTCIPNHTLKALDLSNLTEAQVQSIFDITDHKALRERLNALPLEQLQAILPKLLIFQLKEISNETLSLLDLSGLSVHQLQCLFTIMNIEATQKRFASLSTKQIQSIISKLNGLQLKWIPSEIFKALDLSLLSEPQIQALFSWIDTEATRKRLAELTPCQLKAIKHKFSSYQLKLLPEALA